MQTVLPNGHSSSSTTAPPLMQSQVPPPQHSPGNALPGMAPGGNVAAAALAAAAAFNFLPNSAAMAAMYLASNSGLTPASIPGSGRSSQMGMLVPPKGSNMNATEAGGKPGMSAAYPQHNKSLPGNLHSSSDNVLSQILSNFSYNKAMNSSNSGGATGNHLFQPAQSLSGTTSSRFPMSASTTSVDSSTGAMSNPFETMPAARLPGAPQAHHGMYPGFLPAAMSSSGGHPTLAPSGFPINSSSNPGGTTGSSLTTGVPTSAAMSTNMLSNMIQQHQQGNPPPHPLAAEWLLRHRNLMLSAAAAAVAATTSSSSSADATSEYTRKSPQLLPPSSVSQQQQRSATGGLAMTRTSSIPSGTPVGPASIPQHWNFNALDASRQSGVAAFMSPPRQQQHTSSTTSQLPVFFTSSTLVRVANGELRPVESMRQEDFMEGARHQAMYELRTSLVKRIECDHVRNKALIEFALEGTPDKRTTMELPMAHPLFVRRYNGWASCDPVRTRELYSLECKKLQLDDDCLSLSPKVGNSSGSGVTVTGEDSVSMRDTTNSHSPVAFTSAVASSSPLPGLTLECHAPNSSLTNSTSTSLRTPPSSSSQISVRGGGSMSTAPVAPKKSKPTPPGVLSVFSVENITNNNDNQNDNNEMENESGMSTLPNPIFLRSTATPNMNNNIMDTSKTPTVSHHHQHNKMELA